jgi:hypothetical protein
VEATRCEPPTAADAMRIPGPSARKRLFQVEDVVDVMK